MTQAVVQVSINGASAVRGGVVAPFGATIAITATDTTGWTSALWVLPDFPPGLGVPAGWTTAANGAAVFNPVNPTTPPPPFTLPASGVQNWGKIPIRLQVNGNPVATQPNGAPSPGYNPALTDTATIISILSPKLAMPGIASGESTQYDTLRSWVGQLMAALRLMDTTSGGGGGTSVSGSGLWNNVAGTLQAAALIGTAGQFAVTNTSLQAAFVSMSGDVSASTSVLGKLTVTGLQNVALPAPSGTKTILQFNAGALSWAAFGSQVTGTGVWTSVSGTLQSAALIGTAGQFLVTNTGLAPAFAPLSGDAVGSTVTPGAVTVTGIRNVSVPSPSGTNTTINFNAGVFTWVPVGSTVSVTGSGLWHSVSGGLQSAALIGTAGQFYVVNTTPDAACVSLSGDVSASTSIPAKLTVTGIQGVGIATPTVASTSPFYNGSTIIWASVGGGSFTPGADLFGNSTSTGVVQYVSSLSFSSASAGGTITVNGTNTLLNWVTNAVTLQQGGTTLLQLKATSTDFVRFGASPGSSGFIRAPSNAVVVGINGTSILQTDTGPATYLNGTGALFLQVGSVSQATLTTSALSLAPANILFTAIGGSTTTIGFTSPGTAGGAVLLIRAQSATGANVGGALDLQSGHGSSGEGNLNFANGNTTTAILTTSSFELLPVNLLFFATAGASTTIGFASGITGNGAQLSLTAQAGTTSGGPLVLGSGSSATSGAQGQIFFNAGNVATGLVAQTGWIFDVPVGGDNGGFTGITTPFLFAADQTSGNIALTGTSFALSALQYSNVILTLFGSLTANVTLNVPNKFGAFWVVDIRFLTFNGFTVTFAASGGSNSVSFGAPFSGASTGFVVYIARANSMGLVG